MTKFKIGDNVITERLIKGKVVKTKGTTVTLVTEGGLELTYEESELKFHYPEYENSNKVSEEHIGEKCPRCQTPWSVTRWGSKAWYHCKKCNKKAQDLILEGKTSKSTSHTSKGETACNEMSFPLWDYDDDYDGFF